LTNEKKIYIIISVTKLNNLISYQEWWRDWPWETRQPKYCIKVDIYMVLIPAALADRW